MTTPNHIAGGFVFTGFFASLYNINIVENWYTIGIVVFACLLPDIDHTKSIIGKLFYPLSRQIARRYGHRTITHSLIFLVIIYGASKIVDFFYNYNVTLIMCLGVISHLILDMVTVRGVPLFYPIKKNPCVIPANQKMRITTGNIKSEGIAFFIFALLLLSLQDLFKNGFWTTYNNQFDSIEHIYREFSATEKALKIEYNFNYYDRKMQGSALLVEASENELKLLKNDTIINVKNLPNYHIKNLKIMKTNNNLKNANYSARLTITELQEFLKNKYFLVLHINSDHNLICSEGSKKSIKLRSKLNPKIYLDHSKINELKENVESEKLKIQNEERIKNMIGEEISNFSEIQNFKNHYEKEKAVQHIIDLKREYKSFKIDKTKLNEAVRIFNSEKEKPIFIDVSASYINYF